MMMAGFIVGIYAAYTQTETGNMLIEYLGLLSLVIGIIVMFGRRGVSGLPGGFLTGFGLGTTAGSFLWPPAVHLPGA